MLIKLIKHELRATGRVMLPLFLLLLVTAIGANLTTRGLLETPYPLLDMVGVALVIAFVAAIIAVCTMAFVLMIERFYKNLLQDEGYVMLTLPVSIHQQVWAKLLVSILWFALTAAAVALAGVIMAFDVGLVQDILRGFGQLLRRLTLTYAAHGAAFTLEGLVLVLLGAANLCLHAYAAMSIGQSFTNHKLAWSVAWYFIIQFALRMFGGMCFTLFGERLLDTLWGMELFQRLPPVATVHLTLLGVGAVLCAELAVFYAITVYFLKNKLNLE